MLTFPYYFPTECTKEVALVARAASNVRMLLSAIYARNRTRNKRLCISYIRFSFPSVDNCSQHSPALPKHSKTWFQMLNLAEAGALVPISRKDWDLDYMTFWSYHWTLLKKPASFWVRHPRISCHFRKSLFPPGEMHDNRTEMLLSITIIICWDWNRCRSSRSNSFSPSLWFAGNYSNTSINALTAQSHCCCFLKQQQSTPCYITLYGWRIPGVLTE